VKDIILVKDIAELFSLTTTEEILYSLTVVEDVVKSKVKIRTKQKCPVCGNCFEHYPRLGFICKNCKTIPKKFFIDIHYKGQRKKIYSDKRGHPLDSYNLALETSHYISTEIKDGTFDPSKYDKKIQSEFYIKTKLIEYYEKKKEDIAPSYLGTFKKHIDTAIQFFGNTDVRDIKKINLIKYKDYLESKNLSNKTIKNYIDNLRAFFNYLKNELELITEVPAFPKVEVSLPIIKWISNEDQIKIFEAIPDEHKPIFAFLFLVGCRPGEARALKVKDVNLINKSITISSTFSGNVLRNKRKGRKSRSVPIPINEELYPIIEECVKDKTPDSFVFINPKTGKFYTQKKLQVIWNNIRKKFNLDKNIRLYDATRHSFASNLLNQNVPIAKISKLLGHTNIKTTERYAHVDINSLRVDINKISLKKVIDFQKKEEKENKNQ